jgi:hypothetical protein
MHKYQAMSLIKKDQAEKNSGHIRPKLLDLLQLVFQ